MSALLHDTPGRFYFHDPSAGILKSEHFKELRLLVV